MPTQGGTVRWIIEADDSQFNQTLDNVEKRAETTVRVLKKNDIGAFIEFDGDGDYRVEGDTVYCTKNYKEGKFDFLDFNKGFKLVKKNGKQVLSCKVSDWSIFGYHDCLYDLLYDFDNDKWYGELLQEGEAHENWRKNYEALVESIGAAYVHIVPFHF